MLQMHQWPKFATRMTWILHSLGWQDVPVVLDLEVQHLINLLEGQGSDSH